MRLVKRKEFLNFPHHIVYMRWHPVFDFPKGLEIRMNTFADLENNLFDWYYQDLIDAIDFREIEYHEILELAHQNSQYEMNLDYHENYVRDGQYNQNDERYFILSKNELGQLISRLQKTHDQMPENFK